VIVEQGRNPSGQGEAWLAIIPEPGTGLLVMTGLLGLAVRRRRDVLLHRLSPRLLADA
jgi:hypothetical protein